MNEYPFYVMAKPIGSACNMACRYCYYLEKTTARPIDDATLERFIRQYIEAQPGPWVQFTWHGGEPTLVGIDFFRKVIPLQRQYAQGKEIYNSLQTNGLLINEEWCRFLAEEDWLVGLSIDGDEAMHDHYRCQNDGKATFSTVMHAINLMNRFGVKWNAMAAITDYNAARPQAFYAFFKSIDCRWLQFTPVVERRSQGKLVAADQKGSLEPFSVTPEAWGDFLIGLFEAWQKEDLGKVYVQLFEAVVANLLGVMPPVCTMAAHCGNALVMEADGAVYDCDHFVFPHHYLGNVYDTTFEAMLHSEKHQQFARLKSDSLSDKCRHCQWLNICHGECPRNRFEPRGDNYLCEGYRRFFEHAYVFFKEIAENVSLTTSFRTQ